MEKKKMKYGKHYLEVNVPDYANDETVPQCVVVEPFENIKERKETFIDKIVKFFENLLLFK